MNTLSGKMRVNGFRNRRHRYVFSNFLLKNSPKYLEREFSRLRKKLRVSQIVCLYLAILLIVFGVMLMVKAFPVNGRVAFQGFKSPDFDIESGESYLQIDRWPGVTGVENVNF
jgi:hypothetical protein